MNENFNKNRNKFYDELFGCDKSKNQKIAIIIALRDLEYKREQARNKLCSNCNSQFYLP